jgi:glutathione S-transferase
MLTLYQFPISHFCEKVRWALDHNQLDYRLVNLLPGAHIKVIKSIAAKTEVPVLQHDEKVIQGSSDIITYLDNVFPENSLTPVDSVLKQQALYWETFADENIGPQVRLYVYHFLLDRPDIVVPLLTQGQPWHKRWVFRLLFPKVRARMRKLMHINDRTADISLKKFGHAIDKLAAELAKKPFLAGERFTRADLASASLLAPLRIPDKYGIKRPAILPHRLQESMDVFDDKLGWVDSLYKNYR